MVYKSYKSLLVAFKLTGLVLISFKSLGGSLMGGSSFGWTLGWTT